MAYDAADGFSGANVKTDTQIKAGAGFVHSITLSQADAAPTAGTITIYDSLTEAGTVIYQEYFTTGVFSGHTVVLNRNVSTGIYAGFATTADVNVSISYR